MKTRMMMGTDSPPPVVLYVLLLSLLASCGAGVSLHLVPDLPHISVDSGSEAILQCILNGDSEETIGTFSWTFKQGTPLRTTEDGHVIISHSTSGTVSTLTINGVNQSDEAKYNCSYASLEPVSITMDVVFDPHFKNVSTYQVFTEGTDAVVQCPAFLGDPEGEMYWFRDDEQINDDRFIRAAEHLTIQNARVDDSGTYQCALYRAGIAGTTTITVVVQKRSALAPTIIDPVNPIVVMYGQPLNLTCRLEGENENVRYTWTVDTTHEQDHLVNTTPRLYREPYNFVGGRYLCRAENQYGYDEQLFFVKVLAPPLPDGCFASPQTREEGATIVLEYCTLTSPVKPSELTFQWSKQRQNGDRINIVVDGLKYSTNRKGFLTIVNALPSDSGMYRVNISNSQGFVLHTVQLEVTKRPVSPSESIKLEFEVSGGDEEGSCNEMKTQLLAMLNQYICRQITCAEATELSGSIECDDDSKHGVYTANITGANAGQYVETLRQRMEFDLVQDGVALEVRVSDRDDGKVSTTPQQHQGPDKGGEIAAGIVISVVILSVVVLAVVATVMYKWKMRNHQVTDSSDAEKGTNHNHAPSPQSPPSIHINHTALPPTNHLQLDNTATALAQQPLSQATSGTSIRPTNLTFKGSGKTTTKPPYGRSLSLELPPRKHSDH